MLIADIVKAIEEVAPLGLQEEWDNCGMQIGSPLAECTGVMVCVDPTPEVLEEAIARNCNLIVSHHPLIFSGLKRITGANRQQRVIIDALTAGVSVYSSHTALDNSPVGVSATMADMLGLENVTTLARRRSDMLKLTLYVPTDKADEVRLALFDAGAGRLGRYEMCSYGSDGTGTFRPLEGAEPYAGELLKLSFEPETRLELLLPRWRRDAVECALRQTHPYEEPAYEFAEVTAGSYAGGLGCVGNLREPLPAREVSRMAGEVFGCAGVRCSELAASEQPVRRVALCGGAGGSLIGAARGAGAQIYVSADLRYHDYVDHGLSIGLVDVGHFNSEECAKTIFSKLISEKFPNFALYSAKNEKNPIVYL